MFSASVNKPCNSSTVVDHGMLPTYKRLDCGCSVDMVFVFSKCFNGDGRTDAVAASLLSHLGLETLNNFRDSLLGERAQKTHHINHVASALGNRPRDGNLFRFIRSRGCGEFRM